MMDENKKIFIKDLRKQVSVHNCFVIMEKEIRVSKNGKKYIEMTIGDKTGTMTARKFGSFKDTMEGANLETQELFEKIEVGYRSYYPWKNRRIPKRLWSVQYGCFET